MVVMVMGDGDGRGAYSELVGALIRSLALNPPALCPTFIHFRVAGTLSPKCAMKLGAALIYARGWTPNYSSLRLKEALAARALPGRAASLQPEQDFRCGILDLRSGAQTQPPAFKPLRNLVHVDLCLWEVRIHLAVLSCVPSWVNRHFLDSVVLFHLLATVDFAFAQDRQGCPYQATLNFEAEDWAFESSAKKYKRSSHNGSFQQKVKNTY